MKSEVEFPGDDGVTLRGWLFEPEGADHPPTVVMAHGFSGVKEMGLADYARDWVDRGLAVLAFDYEGFGASDGDPRQEVDPVKQVRAFSRAIDHVHAVERLGTRVGVWGSSFGGGHAITVAAMDTRVTCAVAQVPGIGAMEPIALPLEWQELVAADRRARAEGRPPVMVPIVSDDPATFAVIRGDDRAYRYFHKTQSTMAPAWRNEVTALSLEKMLAYSPIRHAPHVTVPVLVITARGDVLTTPESARFLAARVAGPTEIVELDCTHFEVYAKCRREGSEAAAAFFVEHLHP